MLNLGTALPPLGKGGECDSRSRKFRFAVLRGVALEVRHQCIPLQTAPQYRPFPKGGKPTAPVNKMTDRGFAVSLFTQKFA